MVTIKLKRVATLGEGRNYDWELVTEELQW